MNSDVTRVRQILLNLLSNAFKFTESGRVELIVSRTESRSGEWFTMTVTDTGIGMSAAQLETVFDEFTQGDSSTTRRYGGTGLGLAITQRLCHLLGGTIDADSSLGMGARFTVRLPVEAKQSEGILHA